MEPLDGAIDHDGSVSSNTLGVRRRFAGDRSAHIETAMDELHKMASDITKNFLISCHEPAREGSRLFEDLEQFALEALKTVRSREPALRSTGRQDDWLPGEVRGWWPVGRPVQ